MTECTPHTTATSIVEPLLARVERDPDRPAFIIIENDGQERTVTTGMLHRLALSWSRVLRGRGIRPGDIVIIALPHSTDLITAFWGSLYAGAVASIFPYQFPRPSQAMAGRQLEKIVSLSGARAVITLPEYRDETARVVAPMGCEVLGPEDAGELPGQASVPDQHTHGEKIAYLQYTSGTTGLRKGVLLAHRAILHCVDAFAKAVELQREDVVVNWLPLYHDYGLFAGFVMPVLKGVATVQMSPFKWVRNPASLLWAIHRHRGTVCWMPNSAHNQTVMAARDEALAGLDLSSLRLLGSAGEPVLYKSQQQFLEKLAPFGFREGALLTGFGMAENTLAITVTPMDRRAAVDWVDVKSIQTGHARQAHPHAPGSQPVVSCGLPVEGTQVEIRDAEGCPLAERRVGEVHIRGRSQFSGYHRRPDLTSECMHEGWFATGDLGYFAGGELYICGRKKDLIIVAGKNIHPEDLEAIANSVPGLIPDRSVAFGVADEELGTEKIVMVCDLRAPADEEARMDIERELRRRVLQELDVVLAEVRLVPRGWVVKTHNGKIARGANRQKYLSSLAMSDQEPGGNGASPAAGSS